MSLSEVLAQHSGLRDALGALCAQHIAICHTALEDHTKSPSALRWEQAQIRAWREILKAVTKAKDHEDHHGQRTNGRLDDGRVGR